MRFLGLFREAIYLLATIEFVSLLMYMYGSLGSRPSEPSEENWGLGHRLGIVYVRVRTKGDWKEAKTTNVCKGSRHCPCSVWQKTLLRSEKMCVNNGVDNGFDSTLDNGFDSTLGLILTYVTDLLRFG